MTGMGIYRLGILKVRIWAALVQHSRTIRYFISSFALWVTSENNGKHSGEFTTRRNTEFKRILDFNFSNLIMPPLCPLQNENTAENFICFLQMQCQDHIQTQLLQRKQEIIGRDKQFFLLKIIYIAMVTDDV